MNKQSVLPTASTIVTLSLAADRADRVLIQSTTAWVNMELDALSATVARDKSGGQVARKTILSALVAACIEQGSKPVKDGGLGRAGRGLKDKKPAEVIEIVLGASRLATWRAYLSGVARAYETGARWTTQSHTVKPAAEPADKATSPQAVADTTVTVKADRKARTVQFQAGAKSAVNPDDVQTVLTAITSDPGRMALALAYVKAQGWV
jgi:hypothetical protein